VPVLCHETTSGVSLPTLEFVAMNYPMLPVDAGENALQLVYCFITMLVAMFSWLTCAR
jgi:hypothetical protein